MTARGEMGVRESFSLRSSASISKYQLSKAGSFSHFNYDTYSFSLWLLTSYLALTPWHAEPGRFWKSSISLISDVLSQITGEPSRPARWLPEVSQGRVLHVELSSGSLRPHGLCVQFCRNLSGKRNMLPTCLVVIAPSVRPPVWGTEETWWSERRFLFLLLPQTKCCDIFSCKTKLAFVTHILQVCVTETPLKYFCAS